MQEALEQKNAQKCPGFLAAITFVNSFCQSLTRSFPLTVAPSHSDETAFYLDANA